jgi:hypothetical protein
MVTPKEGTKAHDMDLLISADIPEELRNTLDEIGWLSVNEDIAETFEDVSGSTELTNLVARKDLETSEVIRMLANSEYSEEDDTDMLTKVKHLCELIGTGEYTPKQVLAYDILEKSLGWDSERFLAKTDDFSKALASMDDMGGDLEVSQNSEFSELDFSGKFGEKRIAQLKTMQRVTSRSLHLDDHEVPHLSYAWTKTGILVADMSERKSSDGQAKEMGDRAGIGGTLMKKSHDGGVMSDYHRPARVIGY